MTAASEGYYDLESKGFLSNGDLELAVNLLATKLRSRKKFLKDFTALHMVVLTCGCNGDCVYCQVASKPVDAAGIHMNEDVARSVVDTIFRTHSPAIKIEFQGGEPTLNFPVLQLIVELAEQKANEYPDKTLEFVLCTNLAVLSDVMLNFIEAHNIQISTSLDGPQEIHDRHRPLRNGKSSYQAFTANLERVRASCGANSCTPLVTLTRKSLPSIHAIIDEYRKLGFHSIFLRRVNPYGHARQCWQDLECSSSEYLQYYIAGLEYIIELNRSGSYFVEQFAKLLLSRILTPFSTGFVDLQFPSGAGISGVIYDFDGSAYPTDEARMLARLGDSRFLLGNVLSDDYEAIFGGEKLQELFRSTIDAGLPGCAHCAYSAYCGCDPVRYYVESNDTTGYRPTSDFCKVNMGIIEYLFGLIRQNDETTMDIFWSWITGRNLAEIRCEQ